MGEGGGKRGEWLSVSISKGEEGQRGGESLQNYGAVVKIEMEERWRKGVRLEFHFVEVKVCEGWGEGSDEFCIDRTHDYKVSEGGGKGCGDTKQAGEMGKGVREWSGRRES